MARGVPLLDVAAMAAHLPEGCATHRAYLPPDPDAMWTPEMQLLAELTDRVGRLFAIEYAKVTKRRKIEFPDPIPRPGVMPKGGERLEADTFASPADFAEWYAAQPGGRPIAAAGRAPSTADHPTNEPALADSGRDTSPPADPAVVGE